MRSRYQYVECLCVCACACVCVRVRVCVALSELMLIADPPQTTSNQIADGLTRTYLRHVSPPFNVVSFSKNVYPLSMNVCVEGVLTVVVINAECKGVFIVYIHVCILPAEH